MKPKLSPTEKAEKIARDQLRYAINKINGLWSFGKLHTFKDLLSAWGGIDLSKYFPSELSAPLTYSDVKSFLQDRQIELNTHFYLKNNPPILNYEEQVDTIQSVFAELPSAGHAAIDKDLESNTEPTIKDYGLPPNPKRKCFLFWFQKKAIAHYLRRILTEDSRADYLIAMTGAGKTFIFGELISQLINMKFELGKTFGPWPYVIVTKAPVVEQTKRVLKENWGLTEQEVQVVAYDQMRSTFGKRFVKQELTVEDGIENISWKWRPVINPIFICWDEAHSLKNEGSQQAKIGISYNDIETYTYQLFSSATPGTRVTDFKSFCVATRIPYTFGIQKDAPLCNAHWNDFAKNIASNYGVSNIDPIDHSPAAVDRLSSYMDKHIYRVKGIKWQFHAINKIEIMQFETEEDRKHYMTAVERFEAEKAKLEGNDTLSAGERRMNILAELTIFLKAAESNPGRIRKTAYDMHHDVQEGFAAVAAVKYKITIVKLVQELMNKYGVSRDQISLIWGGAPVINKKQKSKLKIESNALLKSALEEQGISLEDLDLERTEINDLQEYPPELRLGNQSQKQRQEEIDKFQRGETHYCIYTFRAGGTGLSLHHTDEFTKYKVKRKDSGYAVEEDIINVPTRPRRNYVSPTWSAQELVQGIGRCPRLTSLSDTTQVLRFFAGTYEERQARVVSVKLHSLSKFVRTHETWEQLIIGRKDMTDDEVEAELKKDIEYVPTETEEENSEEETSGGIQFEDDDNEEENGE